MFTRSGVGADVEKQAVGCLIHYAPHGLSLSQDVPCDTNNRTRPVGFRVLSSEKEHLYFCKVWAAPSATVVKEWQELHLAHARGE